MTFYIRSSKTKQYLRTRPNTGRWGSVRAGWVDNVKLAMRFNTATEAFNGIQGLSDTSKPQVIMDDGISLWRVSPIEE